MSSQAGDRPEDVFQSAVNGLLAEFAAESKAHILERVALLGIVRIAGHFETFLEELFFDSMEGRHGDPSVGSTVMVGSRAEAEIIVYSARRERYLDWLPWDRTQDRAAAYLIEAKPFSRLELRHVEQRALATLSIVRNAIAHPGAHADEKFRRHIGEQVSSKLPVPTPGGYLLFPRSGRTEYEHTLLRLQAIAIGLAAADPDYAQWLEPAAPVYEGQWAPVGTYKCRGCDQERVVVTRSQMPRCPSCPAAQRCRSCGRSSEAKTSWELAT